MAKVVAFGSDSHRVVFLRMPVTWVFFSNLRLSAHRDAHVHVAFQSLTEF